MNSSNTEWHGGEDDNINDYNDIYGGDHELKEWANSRGVFLFWVAAISVAISVMIFLLWTMGNVQFGRLNNVSYYSSAKNPKSHFGNNPNWRMGFGDAGFGSAIDIPGTNNSLGFNTEECPIHKKTNTSHFVDNLTPTPGVGRRNSFTDKMVPGDRLPLSDRIKNSGNYNREHLDNNGDATTQAEREARQKLYEDQAMKSCADPWDPLATEEARVLASVGTYSHANAMKPFYQTINPNSSSSTLTDAQLEAIMQGQDSFYVDRLTGSLNSNLSSSDPMVRQGRQTQHIGQVPMAYR